MAQYRVQGALFEVEKEGGPAFTGFIEIDGVKTMLALWPKTSAKGQNYFQVSEDKKRGSTDKPKTNSPFKPREPSPPNKKSDMDDDIPF